MLGIPVSIASENLECSECGEKYVCIDEIYAPYGMCLNCSAVNKLIRCTYCNMLMVIDTDMSVE